jgi:hypothetical protein
MVDVSEEEGIELAVVAEDVEGILPRNGIGADRQAQECHEHEQITLHACVILFTYLHCFVIL